MRLSSPLGGRGSSPLARGLPVRFIYFFMINRIIPARAGFTTGPTSSTTSTADHPRSRGVYPGRPRSRRRVRGSSPLARGLLAAYHAPVCVTGIIPARAGFTACPRSRRRSPADHPRSRGVYWFKDAAKGVADGSSPLARGLRVGDQDVRGEPRIIPARAGFTYDGGRLVHWSSDHPRSRGVYWPAPSARPGGSGSSPLARGLLIFALCTLNEGRIIPARAGFTRGSRRSV